MGQKPRITIGVSTGEPGGIGPEITIRAICEALGLIGFGESQDIVKPSSITCASDGVMNGASQAPLQSSSLIQYRVYGDVQWLQTVALHLGLADQWLLAQQQGSVVIAHCSLLKPVEWGKADVANAPYVLQLIDCAIEDHRRGHIQALVTAPVQKSSIVQAQIGYWQGQPFQGHTEYLAAAYQIDEVVMVLMGPSLLHQPQRVEVVDAMSCERESARTTSRPMAMPHQPAMGLLPMAASMVNWLKVALVTTHLPLKVVSEQISVELILKKLSIISHAMVPLIGFAPHIAVCGLNPHAGEEGHLGREDIEVIAPAIAKAVKEGMNVSGPYPADSLFIPSKLQGVDVVLAMYHDQGLAPLKMACDGHGVNITLGLPLIRTSPDHGTALDIAGHGQASPLSMWRALLVASELAQRAIA